MEEIEWLLSRLSDNDFILASSVDHEKGTIACRIPHTIAKKCTVNLTCAVQNVSRHNTIQHTEIISMILRFYTAIVISNDRLFYMDWKKIISLVSSQLTNHLPALAYQGPGQILHKKYQILLASTVLWPKERASDPTPEQVLKR